MKVCSTVTLISTILNDAPSLLSGILVFNDMQKRDALQFQIALQPPENFHEVAFIVSLTGDEVHFLILSIIYHHDNNMFINCKCCFAYFTLILANLKKNEIVFSDFYFTLVF